MKVEIFGYELAKSVFADSVLVALSPLSIVLGQIDTVEGQQHTVNFYM
jgi:hypothetical protein